MLYGMPGQAGHDIGVGHDRPAPPAGRTALWVEPPAPAERTTRPAYLPGLVLSRIAFTPW